MVITILFPEFIVLHVMFELVMAVNALKHMKEKGKKSVKYPWWLSLLQFPSNLFIGICSLRRHFRRATLSSCHSRSEKDFEAQVAEDNNERPDAQDGKEARIWTLTQCLFANMGGIRYRSKDSYFPRPLFLALYSSADWCQEDGIW
jgi:hypothetical protein